MELACFDFLSFTSLLIKQWHQVTIRLESEQECKSGSPISKANASTTGITCVYSYNKPPGKISRIKLEIPQQHEKNISMVKGLVCFKNVLG